MRVLLKWWLLLVGATTSLVLMAGCGVGPTPVAPPSPDAQGWASAPSDDAALYGMALAEAKAGVGRNLADVPDVTLVRWVKPADWPQAQVACLGEAGYAATVRQGGVSYPTVPDGQASALRRAAYVCAASYPVDPRIHLPWSREMASKQYAFLTTTTVPCVRALGVSVDDPPSFEVWYAGMRDGNAVWDPFSGAMKDPEALDALWNQCPATAPDLYPSDIKG